MKTTQEYVKMCEKAVEIQNLKGESWAEGDFYKTTLDGSVIVFSSSEGDTRVPPFINKFGKSDGEIWLPWQDQLQEILREYLSGKPTIMAVDCLLFFVRQEFENGRSYKTWDQFWLAFVMKEKYGKTWNGEEWV